MDSKPCPGDQPEPALAGLLPRLLSGDISNQESTLAGIRHKLRTPINHIIGYSEMLHEEVADSGQADVLKDLEKIQRGGKRLLVLISEYFDLETFRAKKWDHHQLLHELRTPVNHIIGYAELLKDQAADSGQSHLIPDLVKIHTAATRWLRLMEGYLIPSDKPSDPFVPPRSGPMDKRIETSSPPAERSGGGLIPDAQVQVKDQVAATPRQGRLLVVDDDAPNRDMLARRLQRQGYEVSIAENGMEALEMVRARKFDLVLLDMIMPGIDGYQVLQALKADEALRHVPVLMISALDDIDGIVRCIEIGAEDYIA